LFVSYTEFVNMCIIRNKTKNMYC